MTILVLPVAPPITPGLYCLMKFRTLGHVSQLPSLPVKNVEPRFSLFTSKMLLARAPVPLENHYSSSEIRNEAMLPAVMLSPTEATMSMSIGRRR